MDREKETTIALKQGDTFSKKINIQRKTSHGYEMYTPEPGSRLRFIAKRRLGDKQGVLIESEINIETMILRIESEQTKNIALRGREEKFVYDLELTLADGDVYTLISNGTLILVPEVD